MSRSDRDGPGRDGFRDGMTNRPVPTRNKMSRRFSGRDGMPSSRPVGSPIHFINLVRILKSQILTQ